MLLDTPICEFGWKARQFSLSDPTGKIHSMRDSMGENGLLIAFICNHCPYVKAIIERFVADARQLQSQGIGVLAIMSNDYGTVRADSPEEMRLFAIRHGFTFPYLVDEYQNVGLAYGAVCTPDFFGFNSKGELYYRGRLDDVGMGRTKQVDATERTPELLIAMRLIAETGRGPVHQTPSKGCSIKWH